MVDHLERTAKNLQRVRPLAAGEVVLDIGSNDGTSLRGYQVPGLVKIGMDPTGVKFKRFYEPEVTLVPDFFSADRFFNASGGRKASIVSSIAMFYDLEDPTAFVRDVASVLDADGLWHFEQSYMPTMLRLNAYDTICHEHLEYYSLGVIDRLLRSCGLKVVDVQMNSVNGGSIAVTAAHANSAFRSASAMSSWMIDQEDRMGLNTPAPFRRFEERVFEHRVNLRSLVQMLNREGKRIVGYGASTKGNVLLQFCGLTKREVPYIAEVNEDKFGAYTPGTGIPIISEAEARGLRPDYMLVLPWHFRAGIIEREREYLASGGKLIFPLPEIEIL
jgi:hypothetical protein